MKRFLCTVLCACMLFALTGCGSTGETQETEYTSVNDGALWGTEYDGYRVEVLGYEYAENWQSYTDEAGVPAVCVQFYYENGNENALYLLESFGIAVYQDGTELDFISLNSDNEEATNVTVSVKDGAGIYCMMAFETVSDSNAELQITEPTADANLLTEIELTR